MKTYTSKADRIAAVRKVLGGVAKHISKNIVLNGESVSTKDIADTLNEVLDSDDTCNDLRVQLSAAAKAAAEANERAVTLVTSLKSYLIGHYGESSPVLADFGFTPRKKAQKTVAEKYQAVEKQLATRAARQTMGSRPSVDASAPQPVAASNGAPNGPANGMSNATVQPPSGGNTH